MVLGMQGGRFFICEGIYDLRREESFQEEE